MKFNLQSKYQPKGDQPKAIRKLSKGIVEGYKDQILLGVTGSGKTFSIANVIEKVNKPTLVVSPNKTLAAQLCNEFKQLFPDNEVHYFISYYDYYQPEAYIPGTDTYISKEAMINEEIDKLRHAATTALLRRDDVIVVASVSCIYDLGIPKLYDENIVKIETGQKVDRRKLSKQLISMQFERTNSDLKRGTFRLRGTTWQIMPPNEKIIYDFEVKNGKINKILAFNPAEGFVPDKDQRIDKAYISPAKHFLTQGDRKEKALESIKEELKEKLQEFKKQEKYLEAERLERRTKTDLAMIREVGYCHGIENYSRHLSGREPGEAPATLLDYFPDDYLVVLDESHIAIPQIKSMHAGNKARKEKLIRHGFRLPSAIDNRPLTFSEFRERSDQTVFMSATPSDFELDNSKQIVEQIIRPTGLVDPKVIIEPARGQVSDLIPRIKERAEKDERTLVTTLTKRMAEDLCDYLDENEKEINVAYLHSDIGTLDRIKILTKLRKGEYDVIVGVNLLREGLDLPEVSLVAILDADKGGFLRSETALIQTIGRTARNVKGEVLIYADEKTKAIENAVEETNRRREIQLEYNKEHDIEPETIDKDISDLFSTSEILNLETKAVPKTRSAKKRLIREKEEEMEKAAENLKFELAAILRDEIKELKNDLKKDKKDG